MNISLSLSLCLSLSLSPSLPTSSLFLLQQPPPPQPAGPRPHHHRPPTAATAAIPNLPKKRVLYKTIDSFLAPSLVLAPPSTSGRPPPHCAGAQQSSPPPVCFLPGVPPRLRGGKDLLRARRSQALVPTHTQTPKPDRRAVPSESGQCPGRPVSGIGVTAS